MMLLMQSQQSMSSLQASEAMSQYLLASGIESDGFESAEEYAAKAYECQRRKAIAAGGTGREADHMLQYFVKNHTGAHTGRDIHKADLAIPRDDFQRVLQLHLLSKIRTEQRLAIPTKQNVLAIPTN